MSAINLFSVTKQTSRRASPRRVKEPILSETPQVVNYPT